MRPGEKILPVTEDSAISWLGLTRIDGLGLRGMHRLIERFGSAAETYGAPLGELEACGLQAQVAQAIFAQAGLKEAEKLAERATASGGQILTYASPDYPPQLKQIADAPLVLYVRGGVKALSEPAVAIVGTRRPTAYGGQVAGRLARELAERQLVIVSGLARGVDSASHRGALEAGGRTVAVLGSGIDVIYPRENKQLAEEIVASGALISEFPPGTSPAPENFPIRNRIISGLSLGVVVVEAAEYSGSLITARLALEQDREVFAVPGNITSAQSFGPNHLIKQGAKLVDGWRDVVDELPAAIRAQLLPPAARSGGGDDGPGEHTATAPLFEQSLSPDQKAVFEALRVDEALFVDSVFARVDLPQPRVLATLLELEMTGLVRQLPGKQFMRKL